MVKANSVRYNGGYYWYYLIIIYKQLFVCSLLNCLKIQKIGGFSKGTKVNKFLLLSTYEYIYIYSSIWKKKRPAKLGGPAIRIMYRG